MNEEYYVVKFMAKSLHTKKFRDVNDALRFISGLKAIDADFVDAVTVVETKLNIGKRGKRRQTQEDAA